ncbi:hypothetical protein ACA29_05070 [Lederbergia galactosidilytica]|uniref:Uncharacterized protein n=1 Tax=Lederbergia galactosidilytica TaxID=217031 RepID=A0A0Q9YFM1_9BACI|nr:hypothetical protein ACA29_05070 [Lederbergia galactosidilytica]
MSVSMQKMWISIVGMGLFAVAMFAMYLVRYKLKNKWIKIIIGIVGWLCLIIGGLITINYTIHCPVWTDLLNLLDFNDWR